MRVVVLALCVFACLKGAAQAETATYYGQEFAGHRTASGETFNPNALTAARGRCLSVRMFASRIHVTAAPRSFGSMIAVPS
jgi:rare lipoprotein A (peptidoglycan hydrolase)